MEDLWQETLGKMTYGIYVLTTKSGNIINGMIASWVSQISHTPPLIMAAVHQGRYTHELLQKSGFFALHILSQKQKPLLNQFKGPDPSEKFVGLPWQTGKTGSPIIQQCLGYIECLVKETLSPGNHTLFIGEIIEARFFSDETPLTTLDYEGTYIGKN
jgi:flavin reductase (DIM6/NTAB) family NADH-FMN oxidoreductase RutF